MTTQAVFFDLDDTLCDMTTAWKTALSMAFDHVLERLPDIRLESLEDCWTETWIELAESLSSGHTTMARAREERFPSCFGRLGVDDDALATETNLLLGSRMLDELKLFPDLSCLETLRETWPIAIVTNGADDSHPDSQLSKAQRLGLMDRVDGFFASDTFGVRKPDPRFMIHCAEQMGFEPSRVVYVGDSIESDVVGANRAGMTSVLLWRSPQLPPELNGEQRPRVVIHSLHDLVRWADFS
jgi:putative hydrolase of the HAD superfamily